MRTKIYYRVDFKENEYGMWIMSNDEEENYNEAKITYDQKKKEFKGCQLLKITEEILEEVESENPFLKGDYVIIIKECSLKGQKGQIIRLNLEYNEIVVRIDDNIIFTGTFEDIILE